MHSAFEAVALWCFGNNFIFLLVVLLDAHWAELIRPQHWAGV